MAVWIEESDLMCSCELRYRAWNPNTSKCDGCGKYFKKAKDEKMSNQIDDDHSQVMPEKNNSSAIQDLVMRDILDQKIMGVKKYGTALQPFNKRSAKLDKYEELLDAAIYARQELQEEIELEEKLNLKYGDLIAGIQSGELSVSGGRAGMRDKNGDLI